LPTSPNCFVDQRGAFDYERLFLGSFRFIVYKSA
jgi:hypothetical protein